MAWLMSRWRSWEGVPLGGGEHPNMREIVQKGQTGLIRTIPPGMPPGSDVATLSVLGYDPKKYYSGRAPLEAAKLGSSWALKRWPSAAT